MRRRFSTIVILVELNMSALEQGTAIMPPLSESKVQILDTFWNSAYLQMPELINSSTISPLAYKICGYLQIP